MANKEEYIKARQDYIELIKRELLGPGSEISIPDVEHELISGSPDIRYSVGILYPKNNRLNADNDDTARVEESVQETDEEIEDKESEIISEKTNKEVTSPSEEDNLDEEIGLAAQNMPSSMGFTFLISEDISSLACRTTFATYRKALVTDCRIPFEVRGNSDYIVPSPFDTYAYYDNEEKTLRLRQSIKKKDVTRLKEKDILDTDDYGLVSSMYKLCEQLQNGYVRIPHSANITVDFAKGDYVDDNASIDDTVAKITALKRRIADGLISITIMMINGSTEESNGLRCIFQPTIEIDSRENSFVFKEYSQLTDFEHLDEEEQSLELQYRNKLVYGTGLGTAVDWNINEKGEGIIRNEFLPQSEVPGMDFNLPEEYDVEKAVFSMKGMSDFSSIETDKKIKYLSSLVNAYGKWIKKLEDKAQNLEDKYQSAAQINIMGCRESLSRMEDGIQILQKNKNAYDAFCLANRAMFMQRVHLSLQEKTSSTDRYPGDDELTELLEELDYWSDDGLTGDKYFWRPFQMAFMLMSICSIVNENSEERKLVDLIWFPTGGGKTEAYLLLTAFTIFYRRLEHKKISGGTTVIMRYTLRLLAAQQFTRASTLICACELIREDATSRRPKYKKRYPLGEEEISIGLWIGNEHIPNTNNYAKKHLDELLKASAGNLQIAKEQHNKFQVLKCPWCGTKMIKDRSGNRMIGTFGYRMRNNRHFELFCPQESCYFNQRGKLPIQIIDEELYSTPPTLLFGTVDKFAMIPWKQDIGNFFALHSENRSPELIIQDELHLISGPLGTMVGLYESAIDAFCKSKGCGIKIVASTATIRRAKEQCAALYNREVNQFPHPGLDAEDSFFARESIVDHEKKLYGRTYIGLMPSGKTKAMMEVRSIAALLQKINEMDLSDEIKDKFWTLTVYFNSLRDLGKCSTLIDDDVKDFIKRITFRLGSTKNGRLIGRADELTSRVNTTQLNETLDKLEKVTYSKENIENKKYPSNVLLATNMISVGIDVARLNVMLLIGQPKLTSEYIQASSRVGRSYPGIAFALYDGSKSRDRSHYEQFKSYHESFYKYVEPTGATPFSKPARDRALHAVIIAIMRMMEEELSTEKGAAAFSKEKYKKQIAWIKNFIVNRSAQINKKLNAEMEDESEIIAGEIETIFETWEQLAENYDEEHFYYGEKFMFKAPEDNEGRLLKVFNTGKHDAAYDTMTSMRNVDSTVTSNVLIWEDEDENNGIKTS